jgi:hypothetical protein
MSYIYSNPERENDGPFDTEAEAVEDARGDALESAVREVCGQDAIDCAEATARARKGAREGVES